MSPTPEIPKVIHYCWFGAKPLPKMALRCIESWQKYLPGYEIKRWDESNFDVNAIPYTRQAYAARKYAFVSDYARFKILFEEGGLYFDTDVELIAPIDDIVAVGPFMGCENSAKLTAAPNQLGVNPGLGLGVNPGLGLFKEILNLYETLSFGQTTNSGEPKNIVDYTTEILVAHGLRNTPHVQEVAGVRIYPVDYFCPQDYTTGKLHFTPNTRSIHHYAQSWVPQSTRLKNAVARLLPKPMVQAAVSLKKRLLNKQ